MESKKKAEFLKPAETYISRIEALDEALRRLRKADRLAIGAKFLILTASAIVLYKIAVAPTDSLLPAFGALVALFVTAAVLHGRVLSRKRWRELLRDINRAELAGLDGRFPGVDDGEDFADDDHPFSSDLDLFGPHSLFQHLNRTVTGIGKALLAEWLRAPAPPGRAEILRRQGAVRELAPLLDLRHGIRAHGSGRTGPAESEASLPGLFEEPFRLLGRKILSPAIRLLPFLTVSAAVALAAGYSRLPLYVLLLINIGLVIRWEKHCARIFRFTEKADAVLRKYAKILEAIETARFSGPGLLELQGSLSTAGLPASRWIRRLSSILGSFELRRSTIHPVLNPLLLWDLRCVLKTEKWRQSNGDKVGGWLRTVAEIDALSSFANLGFNNPEWAYPEIRPGDFVLDGLSLGTPLISSGERVTNDFRTEAGGSIGIITGPNMAGKSTFLKTVGINMALAYAGAPACATRLSVSPARLVTSMKVSDSLDKGMSLFYAELRRLKMVLDPVGEGERVFFLIDEMLKGTNALDRQKGSIALLHQLAARRVPGLVATHDLQLAEIESRFPGRVVNYHFDGYVRDDRLLFDYKLKTGRCESFNALVLMRKMGIDIPTD